MAELQAAGYRRGFARRRVIEFLEREECCIGAQDLHRNLRAQGADRPRTRGRLQSPRRLRGSPPSPARGRQARAVAAPPSWRRRPNLHPGRRAGCRAGSRRGCRRTCGRPAAAAASRPAARSPDAHSRSPRRVFRSARRRAGSRDRPRTWPPLRSIGRSPPGTPGDLSGDDEHEDAEEPPQHVARQELCDLDPRLDAPDRGNSQHERGAKAHVAVRTLSPRADEGGRQDREQARRFRVELAEAEDERQRGHEQDPAAYAEQAGKHAGYAAEAARRDQRPHQTSMRTPSAASRAAKAIESVRLASCCWSAVPTTAPAAAGRPTTAAASGFTSPWSEYVTAPTSEIIATAASEVAIAGRSS